MTKFNSVSIGGAQFDAVNQATNKPTWLKIPQAVAEFNISRSTIYNLIREGKIKSATVKPTNRKSIRLISYDSLNAYINSQSEGGN